MGKCRQDGGNEMKSRGILIGTNLFFIALWELLKWIAAPESTGGSVRLFDVITMDNPWFWLYIGLVNVLAVARVRQRRPSGTARKENGNP